MSGITNNPETPPVLTVGIAGGSGAGKTRLARRLHQELSGNVNVVLLVHDSYYKDLSRVEMEDRVQTNMDHPDSLETDLLVSHIRDLKLGRPVDVPTYDFATYCRLGDTVTESPRKVILVEGILVLCEPKLVEELDIKVFVDADSDIRLARRLDRDCKERGRTVDQVLQQYHKTVRPMHEEWVEPSKRRADLIVYSAGHSMEVAIEMLTNHIRVKAGLCDQLAEKKS